MRFATIFSMLLIALSSARAQTKPDKDYLVYVLSEGADKISLVRFGPAGASIDRQIATGDMPVDIDGPHGIGAPRDLGVRVQLRGPASNKASIGIGGF